MEILNEMIWPFAISFVSVVLLMPLIIRYFREKQLGQVTREEGPSWHEAKSGTPTMGGVVFILSTVLTAIIVSVMGIGRSLSLGLLVSVLVLYGLIGFIDDFIKLFMKRNLGL